jgi:hypothetical protein
MQVLQYTYVRRKVSFMYIACLAKRTYMDVSKTSLAPVPNIGSLFPPITSHLHPGGGGKERTRKSGAAVVERSDEGAEEQRGRSGAAEEERSGDLGEERRRKGAAESSGEERRGCRGAAAGE